ncbi:MAG: small ribosomal subunit Rsm22 family protein [Chloroflexota bacterium]|nr:small ribosomal subunit Rsm22 family protein [Chloroflexota bacterium]
MLPVPLPRTLSLPDDLHDAIVRALATVPPARWVREAQLLSERYRAPRTEPGTPLATGELQALGYAALILPATYAQLRGALAATAARIPGWAPATMLDLGSGPGTALWTATAQWPSLRTLAAWEREPALIALGLNLARASQSLAVRTASWERLDLRVLGRATGDRRPELGDGTSQRFDLVVLGHVLNELDAEAQQQVVAAAWQRTAGLLLIVEPGTSAAFEVVRAAREQLLGLGAHTIAPCAHDQACPLQNDWCHFPQRLKRPDFQRRAREASSEWEESKFAYAAMARFATDAPIWGRVIREPSSNKAYAEALISTADGVARYRGLKRHRDAFRQVKQLEWGAALEQPLEAPIEPVER